MKNLDLPIIISAVHKGVGRAFARIRDGVDTATKKQKAFNRVAQRGARIMGSVQMAVGGMVGALVGIQGLTAASAIMERAGTAGFNLEEALSAANKQFDNVGSVATWEGAIDRLSQKLLIYSDTSLKAAAARTVDMTKRLGFSADQMEILIERTADLSSGKTHLEDGIERVSAAMRGEAEASELLGLTLNENYVKAWHEANDATGKAWQELNDVEKAQVRFKVFLEQAIPTQGKAAESVKTLAGAYALVRKEIDNSISRNESAVNASKDLANVIRENAGELGQLVGAMITAAAKTIEWAISHKDLLINLAKAIAAVTALVLAVKTISTVIGVVKGLALAFEVLAGVNFVTWIGNVTAGLTNAKIAGLGLKGVLGSFAGIWLAWEVGFKVGTFLEKFDIVKKTALGVIHIFDRARLAGKKFWAQLSGGDVAAVEREIDAAKDAYSSLIADIDRGGDEGVNAHKRVADAAAQSAEEQVQVQTEAINQMGEAWADYANQVEKMQPKVGDEDYEGSDDYQFRKAIEGAGLSTDGPGEGETDEEKKHYYDQQKAKEKKVADEEKAAEKEEKAAEKEQEAAAKKAKREADIAAKEKRRRRQERLTEFDRWTEEQRLEREAREDEQLAQERQESEEEKKSKTFKFHQKAPEAEPELNSLFEEYTTRATAAHKEIISQVEEEAKTSAQGVHLLNVQQQKEVADAGAGGPVLPGLSATPAQSVQEKAEEAVAAIPTRIAAMTTASLQRLIGKLSQPGTRGAAQGTTQADTTTPVKVVELRFSGGSLRGSEHDVEQLLSHLEKAGLTA